ncbi:hypothetical protein NQ317_013446 [Molorchus minor]|uniref:purine-nucleoside phosphorylase n=1 Tax=Molorchus minor TaxID=1323400 RepID=A0ABQ9J5S5_9CUCU|nr:hypothetical protein NQ317_013446 [Molorchus minor]
MGEGFTVQGHKGRLIFGYVSDVPVMCMQGRFHYYEGYPLSKCVMPVRLIKLLGVTHLIASNAAGGLNPSYKVGDIMLQKDHLNIMGFSGIILLEDQMTQTIGDEDDVHEGVYTCMGGPNYETVAELRALKVLHVDAVGMSTVHEVTTAKHCGMKCFAFSLITNICSIDYENGEEATCEEVLDGEI